MLKKLDLEISYANCDLILKIEAIRSHGRVWKYKGDAFVNDQKMAEAYGLLLMGNK